MREDSYGKFIFDNKWLINYGRYMFKGKKRDPSKQVEVVKSVRSRLRQLARLYIEFCSKSPKYEEEPFLDMYDQRNHGTLMEAIGSLSKDSKDELKHGLKISLYYSMLASAQFYQSYFSQEENVNLIYVLIVIG